MLNRRDAEIALRRGERVGPARRRGERLRTLGDGGRRDGGRRRRPGRRRAEGFGGGRCGGGGRAFGAGRGGSARASRAREDRDERQRSDRAHADPFTTGVRGRGRRRQPREAIAGVGMVNPSAGAMTPSASIRM